MSKTEIRQQGPGPYEHPDTRRGSISVPATTPPAAASGEAAPDAELDELLAAEKTMRKALHCLHLEVDSLVVSDVERTFDVYRRAAIQVLSAQRAEAELLRRVMEAALERIWDLNDYPEKCEWCGSTLGSDRFGPLGYAFVPTDLQHDANCPVGNMVAALARPWPSASGLLGLLSELRQDGAGNQPYRRYARVMARRLAAELGLGEEGDG